MSKSTFATGLLIAASLTANLCLAETSTTSTTYGGRMDSPTRMFRTTRSELTTATTGTRDQGLTTTTTTAEVAAVLETLNGSFAEIQAVAVGDAAKTRLVVATLERLRSRLGMERTTQTTGTTTEQTTTDATATPTPLDRTTGTDLTTATEQTTTQTVTQTTSQ